MDVLKQRFKHYGQNTNLHGLRYVADEKRHTVVRYKHKHWRFFCFRRCTFRIFWMLVFLLSFAGMLRIFKGSYESFQQNAISFVTETTYLDWNTTFPAVTVCEITGSEIEFGGW